MENRDILREQRKELLEMFSNQQNKWAELNRKIIWVVISAFASEVAINIFAKDSELSKIIFMALFCTALVSFIIESFRFIYYSKGYFKLVEKMEQDPKTDPYHISSERDAITKVGLKCQLCQMILFSIIIIEFLAYAITILLASNPNN